MSDRWALLPPNHFERRRALAEYLCWRFRRVRREEGALVAAARLRKYGVPLEYALLILGLAPSTLFGSASPRRLSGHPLGRRSDVA